MKKTLVSINICNYGSTGNIMLNIHRAAQNCGWQPYAAFGRYHTFPSDDAAVIKIGTKVDVYAHALYTRVTNKVGFSFASAYATKKLVKKLKEIDPDVIHLHNLHGYYINLPILFRYLCSSRAKIVWTLHHCWPFTGHCGNFDSIGCFRWRDGCHSCPNTLTVGSRGLIDNSSWNWAHKKALFTAVPSEKMILVTPSSWLKSMTEQSYLSKYQTKTIYNGIDLEIFKPTPSDFRQRHNLSDRTVILGVANVWPPSKGLGSFIQLANMIKPPYTIVLLGLSEKQIGELPRGVVGLPRTDNQRQLAEAYSAADVYVNMSREETFGLTTVEALACGTPAIVWNTTASPELITPGCGRVVMEDSLDAMVSAIEEVCANTAPTEVYVESAKRFDINLMLRNYLDLYESVYDTGADLSASH